MKHFNSITLNNIFILGTTDTIAKVMKVASELKLFGAKFAWFALTKVIMTSLNTVATSFISRAAKAPRQNA